ncbi:VWA domain-containing protein [Achromobacter sp. Marseille-Q0513]|uniref:nitric oxide reductase activation protein NorD n=1 Tax=Achromobacter sp. Marseille-Q0513 TaxID=2829161 RepID=UPI001B936E8B|nr:VWA domain-containing protein [Achromobacter sp. Marseille-Q0513]MBR8653017.1 VWA domain-containing protein [Achromobacter sp. Marseille-Q0513]
MRAPPPSWDDTTPAGVGAAGPLAGAVADKLRRLSASRGAAQADEAWRWIQALHEEDPECAQAVAERLDLLMARLSAGGLGRWVLAGLRRHERAPAAQRAYFQLRDPYAREALHGEAAARELEALQAPLSYLLTGLSRRAMTVEPQRRQSLFGPPSRPILTATHLLAPDSYTVLDGVDRWALYRAAVAHAAAHRLYSRAAQPTGALKPLALAVVSAIEDARVECLLCAAFPGARRWFRPFVPPAPDPADLSYAALARRLDRVLMDPALADDNHWVNKARDLFEAQPDLGDAAAFRRLASVLANDLGQMRVRFNPQQHAVPVPYRDDNSYLWDHGESAQPPPEAHALTARGARQDAPPPTDASPPDSAPPEAAAPAELARHAYPEWDYRLGRARPDWSTVIERAAPGPVTGAAGGAARHKVALAQSRRLNRGRRLRRQWEGDDIDLNAAIEVLVDRRLDLAPDARLFMRPGRQPCRCATLVLLDLSESANDLAASGGLTVLDLEKRAALLLAGSLAGSGDGVAVHGFSSDTRAAVDYVRLLDFGESPLGPAAGRVEAARARHSTRLGAALRHAGELALRADAERHAIVVVTDGEPSDVDVHDPRYLVEDARAAALALRRRGLRVHCLALDARAAPQLRAMFGAGGYQLVTNPARLAAALARAYARIAAG